MSKLSWHAPGSKMIAVNERRVGKWIARRGHRWWGWIKLAVQAHGSMGRRQCNVHKFRDFVQHSGMYKIGIKGT